MDKTVLITGASRGIGADCALLFAQQGYHVAINYSSSENKAKALVEAIRKAGGTAKAFKADVSDSAQVNAMVQNVIKTLGNIDILVNNAGIAQQKLFTDLTDEDWSHMTAVNLTGVFNCCRAVLPQMIRRHTGAVVNISSMWGISGASCEVHYSASKGGVIAMTKALAKETAPSGIRVNCICPGVIMTEMNAQLDKETLNALREETPLSRLGTPRDVSKAVLFLAGEDASFITGQILGVDGGFL